MPTYTGSQSTIVIVNVSDYQKATSIVDSMADVNIVEETELATASCTLKDNAGIGMGPAPYPSFNIRWVVTSTDVPGFVTQTFTRPTGDGGICLLPIYFDWSGTYVITPYFDGSVPGVPVGNPYNFTASTGPGITVTVTKSYISTTTTLVVPMNALLTPTGVDVTATATVKDANNVAVQNMPVKLWVDTMTAVNGTTNASGQAAWTIHFAPGAFGPGQGPGLHSVRVEAMEYSSPGTTIRLQ